MRMNSSNVSKSLIDLLCSKYIENNIVTNVVPPEAPVASPPPSHIFESPAEQKPKLIFETTQAPPPATAAAVEVTMSAETINDLKLVKLAQKQLIMSTKKRTNRNSTVVLNKTELNGTFINCKLYVNECSHSSKKRDKKAL